MPRVLVRTATRTGPSYPQTSRAATFFVVGQSERGDAPVGAAVVEAMRIRSMAGYEALAGGRVTYGAAYDALRCYFEEGGVNAYFARVVGASATVGTRSLVDRAGSPLATLAVDAKDPGAWSANVTVQVSAGSVAGSYKLTVRYSGTGGPGIEIYDNLVTPADAVAKLATSAYVRGRDLASATAAPNNQPAILAASALSAGTDDRASIVAAGYTTALSRFPKNLGPGAVAIPGQTTANVGALLMAHAATNRRKALMAAAQGATDNAAIAEAQALRTNTGASSSGVFHPWLTMPDDAGGTRQVDPVGYVAGVRARAQESEPEGPARAPAGQIAQARFVTGVVSTIDDTAGDTLDDGEVNAIRIIADRVELYGWRSLSLDEANYFLLTQQDVLDWAASEVERMLEAYPFATIDGAGRLFSRIAGEAIGLLAPLADAGGLYPLIVNGDPVDPGYKVDTGPSVNTSATIAQNRVRVAIGVRPSPSAAMIEATITKAAVGATL